MASLARLPGAAALAALVPFLRRRPVEVAGRRLPPRVRRRDVVTFEEGGSTVLFRIDDRYSRGWFLPRYRDGRLHEAMATRWVLGQLKSDSVFLDVGANLGWFAIMAAARARAVFAVEAQEFLVGRIRRNASLNGFENVNILFAAAGDAPGFVRMPETGTPGTAVNEVEDGRSVPVIRLDDYFAADVVPDVVKIDVEGYELKVLRGARRLLAHGPKLVIELHEQMTKFGASFEEVHALLDENGYVIRIGDHRKEEAPLREIGRRDFARGIGNTMIFCERPS